MANNYYDATGILVLEQVTPVITALFGGFNLDASYPGNGQAYIARISETNDPQWIDIFDNLTELAGTLGLSLPDDSDAQAALLEALSKHFGCDQDEEFDHLIEHHDFEDAADLDALFLLATRFNDGHNLAEIQFEGCWHCNKPRLFEFGGDGFFLSREVCLFSHSQHAAQAGRNLRQKLLQEDFRAAAEIIVGEARNLLWSITDQNRRLHVLQEIQHFLPVKQIGANS